MKQLVIPAASCKIDLIQNKHIVLVIKQKHLFFQICSFCFNEFYDSVKTIRYNEDFSEVKLDDIGLFIPTLFNMDVNTKKNINALYKTLRGMYKQEIYDGINLIQKNVADMIKRIEIDFEVAISYSNEFDENDLFKIINLKLHEQSDQPLETRLARFIEAHFELRKTKMVFILNLRDFLSEFEIARLYDLIKYKEITIVSIETHDTTSLNTQETMISIDEDLCTL